MSFEQLIASVLCACAEREYRRNLERRAIGASWRIRTNPLRYASAIARHYDLIPEEPDDGTDTDE